MMQLCEQLWYHVRISHQYILLASTDHKRVPASYDSAKTTDDNYIRHLLRSISFCHWHPAVTSLLHTHPDAVISEELTRISAASITSSKMQLLHNEIDMIRIFANVLELTNLLN